MRQVDPELPSKNKHHFKWHSSDIRKARKGHPPWPLLSGKQAGDSKLVLRDGKKMNFEFETNEDMNATLNPLPLFFNSSLILNVEWDEPKKRFREKKAQV